jgi:hypothetical protein
MSLIENNFDNLKLEDAHRKDAIEYLRKQINQMIEMIHLSDSKCLAYQTECHNLENQLEIIKDEYSVAKKNLQEMNTIVDNYKSQLSVMTEHLAALNEKIVNQKDEIDELKSIIKKKVINLTFLQFVL